ncbi:peptidoglycan-binding protein [Brevundimonas sp. VNH65]|uniref:peptidoglycan-binding protein n=1 Tax=Brevundimonas sp. VNH65 TaxID=3400917 RepID=UPI003C0ED0ED
MDSTSTQIERARGLLRSNDGQGSASPWAALAAALLVATAGVLMAGMVVLGPGVVFADVPPVGSVAAN